MLDAVIMNFGDATRVFYDASRTPVIIGVGEAKEIKLDDGTAAFLNAAQSSDSILLLRRHVQLPADMQKMLGVVREIATMDYEDALTRANALLGKKGFGVTRPSRLTIAVTLRDCVAAHCSAELALKLPEPAAAPTKANVDLDDIEIDEEHAPKARPVKKAKPPAKKTKRARLKIDH